METDKYLTLISETSNNNNFTVNFTSQLTFGEDWEVALVQAYVPHRHSHFQDSFKSYFPNNRIIAQLVMHYKTSTSASRSISTSATVRIDDIIDGIHKGTTKLDVLKMIYAAAWNKIMYLLRSDATITAAYPLGKQGDQDILLHQSLEETPYGVTLKGYGVRGGRLTLNITLAQMMDILDAAGTGLGSGVRFLYRGNVNIRRTDTFTYDSEEINLFSEVDWVFSTLHTPWSTRYIPEKVYKHVDINCDMIVPNKVNSDDKLILHHAEIPGDGGLVVPVQRSYKKLKSTSYSNMRVWLTDVAGRLPTLVNEKTRLVLHFRKKPSETIISQTV